jgi:hypothetical protein
MGGRIRPSPVKVRSRGGRAPTDRADTGVTHHAASRNVLLAQFLGRRRSLRLHGLFTTPSALPSPPLLWQSTFTTLPPVWHQDCHVGTANDRSRILKALTAQIGVLVGSVVFAVHVNVASAHFVFDSTASAPQAVGSGQIDLTALSGGLGRLGSFGFTDVATGVDTQSAWAHTASLGPPAEYRVNIHGYPAPSALEPLEESDFSPQYEVLPSMPIRRREIMGS